MFEEELEETLGRKVLPEQYRLSWLGMHVQEEAQASARLGQNQTQTKRVFNIFKAEITDPELEQHLRAVAIKTDAAALLNKARTNPHAAGGKGKASALAVISLKDLAPVLNAMSAGQKGKIGDCRVAETIALLWPAEGKGEKSA